MAVKCSACGKYVSTTDVATCSNCKRVKHRSCVGLSRSTPIPNTWQCPDCRASPPCNSKANSLLRPEQSQERAINESPGQISDSDSDLARELRKFRDEMRETREVFRAGRLEMQVLRERFAAYEEHVTQLEARISVLEEQISARGVPSNGGDAVQALEATVLQLQLHLNNRDQELLRNDIEISGIPEEANENTTHIVLAAAQKLGVTMDERELVCCMRVGPSRGDASSGDGRAVRPRSIVVRLARRASRDSFLRAARVRRRFNTEGLGLRADPKPFYVNERLTRANRVLFNRARDARRENGWRFVWTRDGQVLARKDQDSPVLRIRVESDLARVFGHAQVGKENNSS